MITLPKEALLLDEPLPIRISGCPPHARVEVELTTEIGDAVFASRAVYEASVSGTVDTAEAPSIEGTYEGVDPFGLLWSAVRTGEHVEPSTADVPTRIVVRCGDVEEQADVARRWYADGVEVSPMTGDGSRASSTDRRARDRTPS